MRYRQVILVVKVLFIILAVGLFCIQILHGNYYFNLSERNIIRVVSLEAARGKIIDRNGVVLADTIPSYTISVIPQEIKNKEVLFNTLSELLGISIEELRRNYKKNILNPFTPVRIFEQLDKERIIILEEKMFQLPGVIVEILPRRIYPFKRTAAHVLGYVGRIDRSRITHLKPYGYQPSDSIGYGGVEAYYDLFLRGKKGGEQIEVDNRGRKVRLIGYKPPKPGRNIQISLDIRIQKIVDKFMSGRSGAVVLMDPYSGEIVAMSSHPNYNPEAFILINDERIRALLKDRRAPMVNRAISGQYSPGSVFKVVTTSAAIGKDPLMINTTFHCSGRLRVGSRNFHCLSVHGDESLRDALVHSCNVYFYNLGLLIGPEQIARYAHRLGFGEKTGIDLKYEAKGIIPSPQWKNIMRFKKWYPGDTVNMSIGQGAVLVTPLQITRMISVFANGGRLVRPHLVKSIGDKELNFRREKGDVISNEALNAINASLREIVDNPEGTAHIAKIEGLSLSGKTGTTQIAGKKSHGWFVGYVGVNKPKYAFSVFLEHGGSSYHACVLARKIFEQMMREDLL